MPPNPGRIPHDLTHRTDLRFRNKHVCRNVERAEDLRWSILGASSDITDYQPSRGKR